MPLSVETRSWMGYGTLDDAKVKYQFTNKLKQMSCRRNSQTCLGRSIVPINDGPPATVVTQHYLIIDYKHRQHFDRHISHKTFCQFSSLFDPYYLKMFSEKQYYL